MLGSVETIYKSIKGEVMHKNLKDIRILYDNVDVLENLEADPFSMFLDDVILASQNQNITTLMLHSGSVVYNAIVVAKSAIQCLIHENTEVDELINSLVPGDIIILEGKRVQFLEIDTGKNLGITMPNFLEEQYVCYRSNDGVCKIPVKRLTRKNICRYQGDSTNLTGKGIKSGFEKRKDFMAYILGKEKSKISTEVFHSVAIICNREQAEQIYKNVSIGYGEQIVQLSDLVTAAFYSDNDYIQLGKNPTKEEPIMKFYSKLSSCRNDIEKDIKKRIIGCIAGNEHSWTSNADMYKISENNLDFCVLLGRTHYTRYMPWLNKVENKCFSLVPGISPSCFALDNETDRFLKRKIHKQVIKTPLDEKKISDVKRKLLYLKENLPNSEEKQDFLINSYSVLNLCRSAFFPLKYYDMMAESGLIPTCSLNEKFVAMSRIVSLVSGKNREYVNSIIMVLDELRRFIYDKNDKAETLKEEILQNKVDAIVTTKAYYELIFVKWLQDEINFENIELPKILTVSSYSKSNLIYQNVYFPTVYHEFKFNVFAELGFETGTILMYGYEKPFYDYLLLFANTGKRLLLQKCEYNENSVDEGIIENNNTNVDVTYEEEFEELVKELQSERAFKYVRKNKANNETGATVKAIISFASGEVGYFTEQYKAYCLTDNNLCEVELENLNVGDSILFTKVAENKDIVDLIFIKLLDNSFKGTSIEKSYYLTQLWKSSLRLFMLQNDMTYYEFSKLLESCGCKKHHVTIRSWLYEESHVVGPRDEEDYEAILKAIKKDKEWDYKEMARAAEIVRRTRTKILVILGKVILRNFVPQQNEDPVWQEISHKAETLSQIQQIRQIIPIKEELKLPLNMVNKPMAI